MNIILIGSPGCGKGTQAKRLVARHSMIQLSTGDMLREAIESGSGIGKKIKDIMTAGHLVTDDIVIKLIDEKLIKNPKAGLIFDGFPRTLNQADALKKILKKNSIKLDAVIVIEVDDNTLIKRIVTRSSCTDCSKLYNDISDPVPADGKCAHCGSDKIVRRADDNEKSIKERLVVYYKQTSPLIGYYHAHGLAHMVDGLASVEDVEKAINHILLAVDE